MASGGEPFRDPLYLSPDGTWLDFAAYLQTVGSAPPQGLLVPPDIETLSPWYKQYTNGSGFRVPLAHPRDGHYRVIGDLLAPSATIYVEGPGSVIIWLPSPRLFDPLRAQLVAALHAARYRTYLQGVGLWSERLQHRVESRSARLRAELRDGVVGAADIDVTEMFDTVYADITPDLAAQRDQLLAELAKEA